MEKFAGKTLAWTGGIQGSKCRSDSAREGVYHQFELFQYWIPVM